MTKTRWNVIRINWNDEEKVNDYLADGWEPFAATIQQGGRTIIWLRKSTTET